MLSRMLAGSVGVLAVAWSAQAAALVTEPNGTVVPLDSMNGETQLYTLFQSLSEPIDWQADGLDTPNSFSPLCGFTATFVLHQSGCSQALAWYNETGQTPSNAELHEIIPAGSPLGQVFTGSDIKNDPAYLGGQVGFAIVGNGGCTENHHTNPAYNNMCSGCATPGHWITAVIYASKNTPNSYYIGFEDGTTTDNSWSNDGDFNDDVFFVTGVTCAGGGQPCDTNLAGPCAAGVTECGTGGAITCKQLNQPKSETCDAIDDNCDGNVDEGDICAAGLVCVKGKCVPKCGGGEFNCPGGKVCSQGYCIDSDCVGVDCQQGQICVAGACKGACDGVVCPSQQTCVSGVCVDPCAGVTCGEGLVCEHGACVPGCDCSPCASGLACNAATRHCVDPSCAAVQCDAGTFCQAGSCVEACSGAVCPSGQTCQAGACIDLPSDGGTAGSGGSQWDGGLFVDSGATGSDASADASTDGGSWHGSGNGGTATDGDGGCGCRASSRGVAFGWLSSMLLGAALLWRRRRASTRVPRP